MVRIDTPGEADYYRNGGILQYVLRSLVSADARAPPAEGTTAVPGPGLSSPRGRASWHAS